MNYKLSNYTQTNNEYQKINEWMTHLAWLCKTANLIAHQVSFHLPSSICILEKDEMKTRDVYLHLDFSSVSFRNIFFSYIKEMALRKGQVWYYLYNSVSGKGRCMVWKVNYDFIFFTGNLLSVTHFQESGMLVFFRMVVYAGVEGSSGKGLVRNVR